MRGPGEIRGGSASGREARREAIGREARREAIPDEVRRYEEKRWSTPDQRLVHRREARLLSDLLAAACEPGDRVLDLPCGYGRFTALLAEGAREVVAADLLPAMVRRARERLAEGRDGGPGAAAASLAGEPAVDAGRGDPMPRAVAFCAAEAGRLPFRDGAFDGAVMLRLLQHLGEAERRVASLREVARVASRWAVVSAYTEAPLHRLLRRLQGRPPKAVPRRRLAREVAAAGFRVVAWRRPLPGLHSQTLLLLAPRRDRGAGAAPGALPGEVPGALQGAVPGSVRHLFVYGTLRRAGGGPARRLLEEGATFVGAARVPGRLYDLGDFPGMREPASPEDRVVGEVYELSAPDELLPRLDAYEGCAPADPPPHPFRRSVRLAELEEGTRLPAWVYLYRPSVREARRIPSGDYLRPGGRGETS